MSGGNRKENCKSREPQILPTNSSWFSGWPWDHAFKRQTGIWWIKMKCWVRRIKYIQLQMMFEIEKYMTKWPKSKFFFFFGHCRQFRGEVNGTPLQYSCLENPMDPGAWSGSMGSLRVGHDWATSLSLVTFMHWRRKWQPTPVFLPGESQGRGSLVGCHLWGQTRLKRLSSSSSSRQFRMYTLSVLHKWILCYLLIDFELFFVIDKCTWYICK